MKLVIVGEHPTLNEADPKVGPFGNGFWRYFKLKLGQCGIPAFDCAYLNVINRPAASPYAFVQREKKGSTPLMNAYAKAAYVRDEFSSDIELLAKELQRMKPNLVLAVGELPLIAMTGQAKMEFARGRVTGGTGLFEGLKILPVQHPKTIVGEIKLEPILMADLRKASRQMRFPEMVRPQRFIHLRPSIEDLEDFYNQYLASALHISVDIETLGDTITCICFAPSADRVLVVPFYDEEKPSGNYWDTPREERIAWNFVRRMLTDMDKRTLGQNFSYDVQYIWSKMGIPVPNWTDDTMVLHHALQPEMKKSLGFLASIYTDELQWKFLYKRLSADRSGKKEDAE